MKALGLATLLLVVCVVLFVAGVVAPGRSRRMQKGVERLARKGERKASGPGTLKRATRSSFRRSRRAAAASAKTGRRLRGRVAR